jgi:hypothetical protein
MPSVRALIYGQCLILATVAYVRIDRPCLLVVLTRGLRQMLGLDRAALCRGAPPPSLSSAFLGLGLGALGLGRLLIGRGACALSLNGPSTRGLAKLAGLLAAVFIALAPGGTSREGDEQENHYCARNDSDDCSGAHNFLL